MIKVESISKSYQATKALNRISFKVKQGELFGLIGPDGAGKTSLMRILMTLLVPDEGKASMSGLDVVRDYKQIRQLVGYMPGRFSLYQDLSVEENLEFFATVFGTTIAENYELIKDIYVQIEPFKKRLAGKLSGGMKQKLALSCALIHKPEILVLDEPTTGVDAVSRKEFWEMLKKLQQQGITILVSTPYMDEASLCDRVALMQKGEVMEIDSPARIVENYTRTLLAARSDNMNRLIQDVRNWDEVESAYAFGQFIHVTPKRNEMEAVELEKFLMTQKHEKLQVNEISPGIEDVFMALMKDKE
ncbi:ABC transporter ATP-binding protein [Sunxiuqinia elliptica]|uniref:ABC-type multidrug transport system ATPase subunit n=1 Tax=Sunxiuqinia elliptica TaxID=655355 RepID=A0A4R6GUP8_9BACT|nr:ABC transporter ATP-binding protein [Sunxiuqinia elliptica]TDN99106.1 ABC-type multidrug transport system ATPase subunit [Sunxiuqinia elliptica]TDO56546.1 ABC-type multidrug transport system ATPase subunit [Sunxiuqinia elliptica]